MLVPTTETGVLVLLLICLAGWGAWASALKAAKKWRFEYFYYDFTLGVALAAVLGAFTAGSWDQTELTFQDNFLLAAYRKMAWVLGSGIVFNLGNLFLLGATTTAGMTVAFPIAFGIAWAIGAIWQTAAGTGFNGMLAAGGAIIVVIAAVLGAIAYAWHLEAEERARAKPLRPDPRIRRPAATSPAKGIVLAVIAGLILSAFLPALAEGTSGDNGVSGYGAILLLAAAIFGSTIVYVPFFLNFPVSGEPGEVTGYVKGTRKQHLLGIAGGAIWTLAVLAMLVANQAEGVAVGPVASYVLTRGGILLAPLLGLLWWKEFSNATMRVKMMLAAMFVVFLAGLGMIAVAPMYGGT